MSEKLCISTTLRSFEELFEQNTTYVPSEKSTVYRVIVEYLRYRNPQKRSKMSQKIA